MPREESLYPSDWLRIAEKDLARVQTLLEAQDPEAAGFYLQQAVEKYLKAFLLSRGWKLQRIHDLEALLNAALVHEPAVESFRPACQKITGYYFLERYPLFLETELSGKDVRDSRDAVIELIEMLRQGIDRV
jgi:HEPN domain-containing protein